MSWLQGVGKVDMDTLIALKTIACLVKFEANFHVSNRVWGHHQLIAVKPWK